jgi:hypothetical protein
VHTLSASFVLGFHGCDKSIADRLLTGGNFRPSQNGYDWLGSGIYFWESNPQRGLDYASELQKLRRNPKITKPEVIGAVVDLGLCLDLTTSAGIEQVRSAFKEYSSLADGAEWSMPENSEDLLRRNLDCAVLQYLHKIREDAEKPEVDTVKGIFVEGNPIYKSAGFIDKTHVQICVRYPECIKGVFRVDKRFLS